MMMASDQFNPKPDLSEGIKNLVLVWQEAAKNAADIAHARRTVYNAYVSEGFSEGQALELVKSL